MSTRPSFELDHAEIPCVERSIATAADGCCRVCTTNVGGNWSLRFRLRKVNRGSFRCLSVFAGRHRANCPDRLRLHPTDANNLAIALSLSKRSAMLKFRGARRDFAKPIRAEAAGSAAATTRAISTPEAE